jgi:dienelactone hydrolase
MIQFRMVLIRFAFLLLLVIAAWPLAGLAQLRLADPWPDPAAGDGVRELPVSFPSSSPFVPMDAIRHPEDVPTLTTQGSLFLPAGTPGRRAVPAVIVLHGSSGVQPEREVADGRSLAAMGVEVLLIDSFGSRRDVATDFIDRMLKITETMFVTDAYAGLRFLLARPEIDPSRVVLLGFDYGGMAATYAAYAEIADLEAPQGPRFAGHVAYYAPCIARFRNYRTTGAPILMLWGTADEMINVVRCASTAAELRAGGSSVEIVTYPGAVQEWDGSLPPQRINHNLVDCSLEVEADGTVRDLHTGLTMAGTFSRRLIFLFCGTIVGYPVEADPKVRALSNRDLGRFLARVFRINIAE